MDTIRHTDSNGCTFITTFQSDADGVQSLMEYAYGADKTLQHFMHKSLNESHTARIAECYSCCDDPRLPQEVLDMPIGKREDFVAAFNASFWHYSKSMDEGYDETMPEGVNRTRYAMEKAYEMCGYHDDKEEMDMDWQWDDDEDPDDMDMEAGFYDDYEEVLVEGDKTDFPKKGDDQKISLNNSQYKQFPFAYAEKLKEEYPSIWKRGGNIYGNTAYQNWIKARKGEMTPGVERWIKKREAWAARHFKNKRPAGVVALIKWGVVGQLGVSGMKKVLKPLIDREKKKMAAGAAMEESVSDGDGIIRLRETFVGGIPFESFKESAGGYTNEITVIERGWSLNGNYYGDQACSEIAKQANDLVVGYFNHGETFNRDPRDWAIVTESGRYERGAVKSRIHIFKNPDGAFLEERINYAKRKKANHLFGVSIDAFAQVSEGEAEGQDGVIVDKILKLNSVDIVMVPAAKGNFQANESADDVASLTNDSKEIPMDIDVLKEEHPEVADALIEEGRVMGASASSDEVAEKQEELLSALGKIGELEESLAKATAKVDEYEQAEKLAIFESKVRTMIAEGLDECKRSERFEKILIGLGEDNIETISEMISDRQESTASAVVTGEGVGSSVVEAVEKADEPHAEVAESTEEDRLAAFKANLKG